ncbi:Non-specific serine/threonine protein kinase [Bertholletia excelsa]
MAELMGMGRRCVGDYLVLRQIGRGSFSVVWHARHRVHGAEVAIKEIETGRLNKKLHDSLMSEIDILKQINHPNIIRLHDIIEETGRIHIVLEYCRGGDLSMYIQQSQGRVTEAKAKHLMQQLAAGLQILRRNNLIHRDLKPQNLLLSTNDENAVLKIADFGFARPLQPRVLAETLCGSPLYMAPEIMLFKKYDAKADLWSVGAILYQLVTGKTPFTGNSQTQLLQNIVKSAELQFPHDKKDLSSDCMDLCRKLLRPNPVERMTFEELFNHPFLSQRRTDDLFSKRNSAGTLDAFLISAYNPIQNTGERPLDDYLPFSLDDISTSPQERTNIVGELPMRCTYGFSFHSKVDTNEISDTLKKMDLSSKHGSITRELENNGFRIGGHKPLEGNLKKCMEQRTTYKESTEQGPTHIYPGVVNSLELTDQDYVLVPGPPLDESSALSSASNDHNVPCKLESSESSPDADSTLSEPIPIIGVASSRVGCIGSLDSHSSAPYGTSQESTSIGDALEQPSTDCMTRIKSLQKFASALTELVNKKIEASEQLEAFSIELVILSIWKRALHICHTQAVSTIEGSPTREISGLRESSNKGQCSPNVTNSQGAQDICCHIEKEFLLEIGKAEELSKLVEPGNNEMPDAMEIIYQSALALGKGGAVEEYMGNTKNAGVYYSKAVCLLVFLQVEAPSLILNPPFSLTNSDRYRLQTYIDVLNNRPSHSRSQRINIFKCEVQQPHLNL